VIRRLFLSLAIGAAALVAGLKPLELAAEAVWKPKTATEATPRLKDLQRLYEDCVASAPTPEVILVNSRDLESLAAYLDPLSGTSSADIVNLQGRGGFQDIRLGGIPVMEDPHVPEGVYYGVTKSAWYNWTRPFPTRPFPRDS
jgi:hypothetical protein